MRMKIRKGDRVRVLAGKDRGKEGVVTFAFPETARSSSRASTWPSDTPEARPGRRAGRHHRQGDADRTSSNVAVVSPQDGKPTRVGYRFEPTAPRSASASAREEISDDRHQTTTVPHAPPQGRSTTTRSATQLQDELGLPNVMVVPRLEKIVVNMGVGEAVARSSAARGRHQRPGDHHRPEAGHHQGQEVASPASSCARATPSAPRSPCAAIGCGSSSTGSSAWPSPVSATSGAQPTVASTATATTPSA